MRKEREAELEALLRRFTERIDQDERDRVRLADDRTDFFNAFEALKRTRIRPVMEAFRDQLRSNGQSCEVVEHGDPWSEDVTQHPTIELRVEPSFRPCPAYAPDACPWVRFEANGETLLVHVHTSTVVPDRGGTIGSRGDYQIEEVTSELVEQEIMEVLRKVYGEA